MGHIGHMGHTGRIHSLCYTSAFFAQKLPSTHRRGRRGRQRRMTSNLRNLRNLRKNLPCSWLSTVDCWTMVSSQIYRVHFRLGLGERRCLVGFGSRLCGCRLCSSRLGFDVAGSFDEYGSHHFLDSGLCGSHELKT